MKKLNLFWLENLGCTILDCAVSVHGSMIRIRLTWRDLFAAKNTAVGFDLSSSLYFVSIPVVMITFHY